MRRISSLVAFRGAPSAPCSALVSSFALFSLKEQILAKRRQRDDERNNIRPDDDDDEDGNGRISEEDQRRLSEEEEERQRELAAATQAMLKERDEKDKLKRDKFKQWRAGQIQGRKDFVAANARQSKAKANARMMESEVTEEMETKMENAGDMKEGDVEYSDIDEKRKAHRANKNEARRMEREEQ